MSDETPKLQRSKPLGFDTRFKPGQPSPLKGRKRPHKPSCACPTCFARRRKEEALAERAGTAEGTLQILAEEPQKALEADFTLVATADTSSPRGKVASWIAYRNNEPGITNKEIARRMGISPASLNATIQQAVRGGWLKIEDPLDRVEFDIIPKTIEKLSLLLDEGDAKAIVETAKGVVFPLFKDSRGIVEAPSTVLAIKIDMPEGETTVSSAKIVGKPRYEE